MVNLLPRPSSFSPLSADLDKLLTAKILRNFISGLQAASLKPKRFLLQTGAKNYGFHIGPATSPSFESDPRITLENNFYYPQEDLLSAYCAENKLTWNVMRPSYIIGAVRDNLLNNMVGLAIYASVCAYLKEPLAFPGDYAGWDREHCQSTAMLNSYFYEWAVFNPEAGNEAFNVQDGLPFTWGRFWAYLGNWYGIQWTPPEEDESKYRVVESRHQATPRGYKCSNCGHWKTQLTFSRYGPHASTRSTFSLVEWSAQPKVEVAWKELTEQHGLRFDPFADRASTFGVTDSAIIGGWALSLSIRKARKMGWTGSVDSYESSFYTLRDLARLKVAPPMKMTEFVE